MSYGHVFTCKHGRHSGEPCTECLINWSEHCIASSKETIAKHERKIVELRKTLADAERTKDASEQRNPTEQN